MLVKILPWDFGMISAAMHCIMYGSRRGAKSRPREYEQIVAYAKRMGLWEGSGQRRMESIGNDIGAKMRGGALFPLSALACSSVSIQ